MESEQNTQRTQVQIHEETNDQFWSMGQGSNERSTKFESMPSDESSETDPASPATDSSCDESSQDSDAAQVVPGSKKKKIRDGRSQTKAPNVVHWTMRKVIV